MSSYATVVLMAVQLALLVPLAVAWFRPRLLTGVVTVYGVAFLALGLHQTGLLRNDVPRELYTADLSPQSVSADKCNELIDALKQAGAVSQDSRFGAVEFKPELWQQIPEAIRESIAQCMEPGEPARI